ncbi:MAG: hypothetical protein JWO63_976 [Frankiales bacterium]|jgi:hypothetical protein|nr:hypothetical protein [Frankiales bacterium]
MATVRRRIAAPPEAVFQTLADGWVYSNWVVGTSHMRAVDRTWPAPGAKLYHATGSWPVVLRDETQVESAIAPSELTLIAKGRPLGTARVVISLSAVDGDTEVTMTETPIAGPGHWLHNPVSEALLARRNVESLARLAVLVERPTEPQD